VTLWFAVLLTKFIAVSSVAWLVFTLFAKLRDSARERFLLAKIGLIATPVLAFVSLPIRTLELVFPVSSSPGPSPRAVNVVDAAFAAAQMPGTSVPWVEIGLGAYSLTVAILVTRFVFALIRLSRIADASEPAGDWQGIPVRRHHSPLPPSTFGLTTGKIYLPAALDLSPSEFALVCGHEAVHVRRKDFHWKLLVNGLACFTFISPLWLLLWRRFEEELELSCDEVVRESVPPKEYASLLVRLADHSQVSSNALVCGVSANRKPFILRRVSVMRQRLVKQRFGLVVAAAIAILLGSVPTFLFATGESATTATLMDPREGIHFSLNGKVKSHAGNEFNLKMSRVIGPGKIWVLGGDGKVSIGVQYEVVGEDLEIRLHILNAEMQSIGGSTVIIPPNGGADVEGTYQDPQNTTGKESYYSIEFWDVTRKRAMQAAKQEK
jgi:beta-lactamase regulating signal transducer with metallopeptidase domain